MRHEDPLACSTHVKPALDAPPALLALADEVIK